MFDWITPPAALVGPALTAYVLFDLFLIVVLARLLGSAMAAVRQPRVVGEILAGIMLSPTLLGDNLSQVLVPLQVRPILAALAALGLILFMFLAGVEFETSAVRGRVKQAGLLALLSVALPALLGFPLAQVMHSAAYIGPAGESRLALALLLGAALSVTAFPIMAHILMERGELNTPLGALGVATAAIMSVLMFTYIAFAGAVAAAGGFGGLLITIMLILLFGLLSWFAVRPLLARWLAPAVESGTVGANHTALVFAGLVLYGLLAQQIGVNALVGGFVWGLILPPAPELRRALAARVRDVALILLLPVFFALSGFATDLKLLTLETLPVTALVLLAAIAGKFLGAAPARAFGLSWNEVGILGALVNTRGLLVLVAGLIGLELAIISNLTFTILVVVALVTNLMTVPLLDLFALRRQPDLTGFGNLSGLSSKK